ncbi:unnamed protein product [Cylicostephanus goldi]|uniref:Uncharacterized protein n=1 Tax=Cylicostephanus goldi TaxID=71465 RepID=A0A3P6SVL9_CYLGO|nr:unnamed protein product [Cylicostephanus goldi]
MVVDKVCNPSAHKKRGRPRNDDVLAAWEKYVNRTKKRRQNLPRSAKKPYEAKVHDFHSDDGMSLELPEDYETESQSSQVASTSALYDDASNITLREFIARNRTPSDDEVVRNTVFSLVDQICSREKKKRGRPPKNHSTITTQESEVVLNGTQCSTSSVETTAKPCLVFAEASEIEHHIFEVSSQCLARISCSLYQQEMALSQLLVGYCYAFSIKKAFVA